MTTALTLIGLALTIAAYALSRVLAKRFRSPFTNPVFFSTVLIILVLSALDLDFEHYAPAKDLLVFLLGPATVALAAPLYKNRQVLLAHGVPALLGLLAGSITTVLAAVYLALLFGLSTILITSLSLKSVTAPIAIEIARIIEASPVLTAGFVVATGMIGSMFGPWLMDWAGIHHPVARGLALGTIAHGQGTAQAIAEGEVQGATAGIAMALTAVMVSFSAPWLTRLLGPIGA